MTAVEQRPAVDEAWFDSHCHLQDEYVTDKEEGHSSSAELLNGALQRASEVGVTAMVCVGTGPETSRQALSLARARRTTAVPPELWATVGLHPHEASSGIEDVAAIVAEAMDGHDGALVAIGECGLDYYYEHSPRPAQRLAFAQQIVMAHQYGLALVIHARDAWDDLFDILAAEGVPERTVLHCFTGGPQEAKRCLEAGMFVSFSGIVTFKNATPVREAAALVPIDRLLVETDSPFLAPVPFRGRSNEPALVRVVGEKLAEVRGVAPSVIARATAENARLAFALEA
jgi:TatD DNase family protein